MISSSLTNLFLILTTASLLSPLQAATIQKRAGLVPSSSSNSAGPDPDSQIDLIQKRHARRPALPLVVREASAANDTEWEDLVDDGDVNATAVAVNATQPIGGTG